MHRLVVSVLAVALSLSVARAETAPTTCDESVKATPMRMTCAQMYVDRYNQNPADPRADETLFDAAVSYDQAHATAAALSMFSLLRKSFPDGKLAIKATLWMGKIYSDIALYDRAADVLEEYVKKYAGEADAYDAMNDAVMYRRALGQFDKAIHGACVKTVRVPARGTCKASAGWERVARKDKLVKEASAAFAAADKTATRTGDDAAKIVVARAHLARTRLELEVAAFVGKQGRRDSERVREAVAEIDRQVTKLVQEKDVGVVISAHYFHAWTAELIHSHLVRAACTEPPYPAADPVASLLRNAARAGYERCIEAAHSLQWPDATALTCARSLERLDPSTYPPFSELAGRSAPIGYVPAVEGLMN